MQDEMHLMHSDLWRVSGVCFFFSLPLFNVSSRKMMHLARLYMTLAGVTMGQRY